MAVKFLNSITLPVGTPTAGKVWTATDTLGNANWTTITSGTGITRVITNVNTTTTAAAVAATDYVYNVSGTTTLTMPTVASNTNRYTIKNTDPTLIVTVAAAATQTVEGATSLTLAPSASIDLMATSTTNFGVY